MYDYYVWVTCRAWRHRLKALRAQSRARNEYDFGTDAEETQGKQDKDKTSNNINQSKAVNNDLVQLKRSSAIDLLQVQMAMDYENNFVESDYEDYSQDEKQKQASSKKVLGNSN